MSEYARRAPKGAENLRARTLSDRFVRLSDEQQIELGKQMADGRLQAEEARNKLTRGDVTVYERQDLQRQIFMGESVQLKARDQLIDSSIPLVKYHVTSRISAGESSFGREDYFQEGLLGLVKAAENYDWKKGKFSSFATSYIKGEMQRAERDKARLIKFPRSIYEQYPKVQSAKTELWMEQNYKPSDKEVAEKSGVAEEVVRDVNKAEQVEKRMLYLDADDEVDPIGEPYPVRDSKVLTEDEIANIVMITNLLTPNVETGLDERAKKIVRLTFYDGLTQAQIGREVGLSQMQVSRLLPKALAEIKQILGPQEE